MKHICNIAELLQPPHMNMITKKAIKTEAKQKEMR